VYLEMLGYILDVIMSDQSIPRHHNVLHEPRQILIPRELVTAYK
jgi:hypothetical protein